MRSKFKWILTLLLAFAVQVSFAQEKNISGKVLDNNKEALPGVNIVVKGTKKGTQTDFDGNYSIKAKEGETLVFSYIGMKDKETKVGVSSTVNVTMETTERQLTEVVVTSLGIKKAEKSIGYSVQNLKGDDIAKAKESNLLNALQGKTSGVQITSSSGAVGSSTRVLIRGAKTISGNNAPLYVIDGSPVQDVNLATNGSFGSAGSSGGFDLPNALASINPEDIENVSILKGPNASALYGSRASNGVIIITTKSGKKSKTIGVDFSSSLTFSNPLILPDFQNSYGQGNHPNYFHYVDGANGGFDDGIDESWGPALDRGLEFVQWDSYKVGGAPLPWVSHPDNVKNFYNTGLNSVNNLSFSGGSEDVTYRLGISSSDEEGMVPFTEFKKFSINGNFKGKLSKDLSVGLVVNYLNDNSDNLPTVGYSNENPVQQFIWSARNVNFSDLKDWRNLPSAPTGTPAEGTPLNWNNNYQNNPYWVLENNRNTFDRDRVIGNVNLQYDFSNSLSMKGQLALDHFSLQTTERKLIGTNSSPDGFYQVVNRRFRELNSELTLNYKKEFFDNFKFNLSAGVSSRKSIATFLSGTANALELPNLFDLNNVKNGTTPVYGDSYTELRANSVYTFGGLSYKDYAFLEFTGRNDWSSNLPINNNSFFYPSVSLSFILSDMFDTSTMSIDYLKLRGGWAKVGGYGALTPYQINTTYVLNNNGFGLQATNQLTGSNANLNPEFNKSVEIGLDAKLFKSRLRIGGSLYSEKITDLLIQKTQSNGAGYRTVWDNLGVMTNKGVELQIGGSIVDNEDFSIDLDVNFTKNVNEITDLNGADAVVLGGQWGLTVEAREGQPYGVLVGKGFQRDSSGNVIHKNGLPLIDSESKVLGNATPDWTGGATLSIKYKGFDLSSIVDSKIGGDIHSMTYAWGRYAGTLEETLVGREGGLVGNGVMSDGNGGYVQNNFVIDAQSYNKAAYQNGVHESSVFDASFVKLREISLGYNFPQKWLQGSFIQNIRLSLIGRNLAILYKKAPHIDPESSFSNTNGNQGLEFGQLPSARTYGFNINVKF